MRLHILRHLVLISATITAGILTISNQTTTTTAIHKGGGHGGGGHRDGSGYGDGEDLRGLNLRVFFVIFFLNHDSR
jgi:hypothetical protein